MLMKCKECDLQVSDKASFCPHCGYPFREHVRIYTRPGKKRRLPNGFGQISEVKGHNLRNPFRAMVTVGKAADGRPICKSLKPEAYFATYNDAYAALVEYNKNPYSLEPAITVAELYEKWTGEYFKTLKTASSVRAVNSTWAYCSAVYNMRVMDIRARHVKGCMDEGVSVINGKEVTPSANMKNKIKTLFNQMLDYALEYEIVDRNYSRSFTLSEEVIKEIQTVDKAHVAFTNEEMALLWENVENKRFVDTMLIQCYSGWRPRELCGLELANIDLVDGTFKGGMKTEAGIDRVVPIHSKIRELVTRRYHEAEALGSKYLFNIAEKTGKNEKLSYEHYLNWFKRVRDELKLNRNHRPHDGRTHFVTSAKKYGVDEYAIKYLVGHKISDITEKVYTKREFDWLREEIEKIK